MEEEVRKKNDVQALERSYKLLSSATRGQEITVRDDHYEFPLLLDSVKLCRQKNFRFRLIDSGQFDRFKLEWIAEAGADLYTSDDVRSDFFELELVNKSCKKGGSILAYFHHGALKNEESAEESVSITYSEILGMGRSGTYVHLSNKERRRDFAQLVELAHACRKGKSWLVYYHRGPLDSSLEELGRNGAWIHLSDRSLHGSQDMDLMAETVRIILSAGTRLVLHVEEGLNFSILNDFSRHGAFIFFKSQLFDYKSPFRTLEEKARKRKLDFRAYYLYPTFLL